MRTKLFLLAKLVFTVSLFLITVMAADVKVSSRAPAFSLSKSGANKTTLHSLTGQKKTVTVKAADLKVGTRAPAFSLSNSDGNKTTLQSLTAKKKTVLVFFRTLH